MPQSILESKLQNYGERKRLERLEPGMTSLRSSFRVITIFRLSQQFLTCCLIVYISTEYEKYNYSSGCMGSQRTKGYEAVVNRPNVTLQGTVLLCVYRSWLDRQY